MKKIWFCFVTKNNKSTASQLIESIENQILKFKSAKINLLVLDKTETSTPLSIKRELFQKIIYYNLEELNTLEKKYNFVYLDVNYDLEKDSIQRARLQLYIASLEYKHEFQNAIIWQLDDDMLLGETVSSSNGLEFKFDRNYCQIIRDYNKLHPQIDAAVGFCSFVPPLPQFLYLRKQLEEFLSKKEIINFGFQHENWGYHDLYNTKKKHYKYYKVRNNSAELLLDDIFKGKPSHPILTLKETPLSKKTKVNLLRGGNFIVFNSELLTTIPHIAFSFQNFISRRSDMLHSWMLTQQGFNVSSIDLSLIHNRNFKEISFPKMVKAYFEDLLGAIAIRYIIQSPEKALERFQQHKVHLLNLQQLSVKLTQHYKNQDLQDFKIILEKALSKLDSFSWKELESEIKILKTKVFSYLPLKVTKDD